MASSTSHQWEKQKTFLFSRVSKASKVSSGKPVKRYRRVAKWTFLCSIEYFFDTCSLPWRGKKSFMRYSCSDFTRAVIIYSPARRSSSISLCLPSLFASRAGKVRENATRIFIELWNVEQWISWYVAKYRAYMNSNIFPFSNSTIFSLYQLFSQIHDTKACLESDCARLARGSHDSSDSVDMEQVGVRSRMWIRRNILSLVHGRCDNADILACMARDALCLLSNMARSIEASEAAEDTGTAGRIGLEECASKFWWQIGILFFFAVVEMNKKWNCIFSDAHEMIVYIKIAFHFSFRFQHLMVCALKLRKKASNDVRLGKRVKKSNKMYSTFISSPPLDVHWFIFILQELKWMNTKV